MHKKMLNETKDTQMDEEDTWREKITHDGITDEEIADAGGDPMVGRDP